MTPRRTLSRAQKAEIIDRQKECCAECGGLFTGAVAPEFDHILPLELGGDNDPDNMQALCRKCHRRKTDGDIGRIAKAKRQAGETGQRRRRLLGAPTNWPKGRKLGSW